MFSPSLLDYSLGRHSTPTKETRTRLSRVAVCVSCVCEGKAAELDNAAVVVAACSTKSCVFSGRFAHVMLHVIFDDLRLHFFNVL